MPPNTVGEPLIERPPLPQGFDEHRTHAAAALPVPTGMVVLDAAMRAGGATADHDTPIWENWAVSLMNLTPHPVRVYNESTPDRIAAIDDGLLFVVPPSGQVARIAMIDLGSAGHAYDDLASGYSTWIDWQQFGQCNDLPAPEQGTTYIVALIVARDQTHRTDLIFPMSEVRNTQGTVVGCRGFGRVC